MANNDRSLTGVQVTNAGNRQGDITITYGPNTADPIPLGSRRCAIPDRYAKTLPGVAVGASVTFLQRGTPETPDSTPDDRIFAGCTYTYVGSVTVTAKDASGAAQSMVAVVNQVGGAGSSAYEAVAIDRLTETVRLPLVQAANYHSISGIQVQNAGTAPSTIDLTFAPTPPILPVPRASPSAAAARRARSRASCSSRARAGPG